MIPTRPQLPLIDDGYLVEPESPSYEARRVGGCLLTLAILAALAISTIACAVPTFDANSAAAPGVTGANDGAGAFTLPSRTGSSRGGVVVPETATPSPAPTGGISTALLGGWATWFDDGPGLYAAVSWWRFGDAPYPVRVCAAGSRCVIVTVRDFCACGERRGVPTIVDLSPAAMALIEPDYRRVGVVLVSVEWLDALPATSTEEHR